MERPPKHHPWWFPLRESLGFNVKPPGHSVPARTVAERKSRPCWRSEGCFKAALGPKRFAWPSRMNQVEEPVFSTMLDGTWIVKPLTQRLASDSRFLGSINA